MKKVRIGFVGVGGMGQMAHLRNYATLEDCEVVAIAEVRGETGARVAATYHVPRVYASHTEMLAREELDGVVASQRFEHHATLVPELYGKVRCLFTEKPLAVSVEAGRRLAELAKSKGTVHMVGYHKRCDPATVYAKETIEQWKKSGEMGALRYVRILMPAGDWVANGFRGLINAGEKPPAMPAEPPPSDLEGADASVPVFHWQGQAAAYIAFVNYYIHQVNLMRHLLGEPYEMSYADASGVPLAVKSASGVAGVIEMTPYRTTVAWEESALIAFENGYVQLRLPAPLTSNRAGSVEVYRDPGKEAPQRSEPTLPWDHAMRCQASAFVRVCRGESAPPCDAAEAVEDLQMARDYIRLRYGK